MNDNTLLEIESRKGEAVSHSKWFEGRLCPVSQSHRWQVVGSSSVGKVGFVRSARPYPSPKLSLCGPLMQCDMCPLLSHTW